MKSIYVEQVEEKWRDAFSKLVDVLEANLPVGFEQTMQYDMVSYVVPLETYPSGYHVTANTHYLLLVLQRKNIILRSTIWVYMQTKHYFLGFRRNMRGEYQQN